METASSSPRPHVLMLVDALEQGTGGAERFAAALACALPAERYRLSFCTTRHAEGGLLKALEDAAVQPLVLGREGRADMAPFVRLSRFMRREGVDVLHCHKFGSNVWGTLVGRLSRVPVVIAHEHTWSYEGQPLRRLLDGQLIGRLATRFVAVSELDRSRMVSVEGVRPEKTLTIPTAYIPRAEEPPSGDVRAELGIPAGAPVVGTVAQLRPQKALDVLIAAFEAVARELPDARLLIAGDGPERDALRERAKAAGLADRVHLPGVREDITALFAAFDVAAMSSHFEGMPLFMFEAMAHATPLVATRVGGIPDVVEDGRTGLLVPPGDSVALADALLRVLRDDALASGLAAAAGDQLPSFTLEAVAGRFGSLYDELLAEARG